MSCFTEIQKRDGTKASFDPEKIIAAITKAGIATGDFGEEKARELALTALARVSSVHNTRSPNVEQVQDCVEEVLMDSPYKKTAKAYVIYRNQHAEIREITSKANVDLMDQYLHQLDWQVKENSNMTFSLQGLNNYISSEVSKIYWLNKIYPQEIKQAHQTGDIHIHDLNLLSSYCVGWDLKDLLMEGFKGVSGKSESRPAKHFRTALGQVVNFLFTLQGESAGAQAFSNFDTLLAPFIRYDKLSHTEVKQALQEFIFNLNVPTRIGFQTPFTNITLDLNVPSYYRDEAVIIGGKLQNETYKEFQCEMDMLNEAFCEVMLEGDAKGRIFTFPIPTINITSDFDWENPKLNKLWELTSRYGTPYFSNFINSDMKPEDARSMCCRLRIDNRELEKKGGLFGSNPLTGSLGVVTINMPRLGQIAKSENDFLEKLGAQMELAKNSLEIKRQVLEGYTDKDLYPYTKFYLRSVKERYGQYWKNHFSTIGLVGMNEACLNLLGENISEKRAQTFTVNVLTFMKEKLKSFQEETKNNYNLEATPAEGVTYRLAKLDQEKFPGSATGNPDKEGEPFYTNSTNLPVNFTDDVFEVLDLQNNIQREYTGGTVLHIFVGEKITNINTVKHLVKKICENYELPYFTITPTFSICKNHGHMAGEHKTCPKCHEPCEIYSRVVGYLRPVDQWNNGKRSEFEHRKTFKIEGQSTCKSRD